MFPWTHAAFGYLLLVGLAVLLRRRVSRAELVAVVVGTQLPDLVDKPLAWYFNVIPSGRSLAHSLLLAIPLSLVVLAVAWYRSHPGVGFAFGIGYLSHLFGDVDGALYQWDPEKLTFLLWPVLPPYPSSFDSVTAALANADVTHTGGCTFGKIFATPGWQIPSVCYSHQYQEIVQLFAAAVVVGAVFLAHFLRAPWWGRPRAR